MSMHYPDNPLCVAWLSLNGTAVAEDIDLRILARVLIHDRRFNPDGISMELFVKCIDEITGDPDTYPQELRTWASYAPSIRQEVVTV